MLNLREELSAALSDRYQILSELGQGGFATVFEARDLRHDSRVALKALRPEFAAALGAQRFSQEVRITARLQHPNILPLLDSGTANGFPWYVMPLVEGESLAARVAREGPLPIPEAVRLVAEVADGLVHAHAQGVVHRDIKPDNILLSHGHAILSDFGIARAMDVTGAERLTDSGIALGTVTYMSPEQGAGERVDARADIYALGCVLYEALTGAPPFTGPTAQSVLARHAVDPPASIRSVRATVPPALEAAVFTAMAKSPVDRFQQAAAFREAILEAQHGKAEPVVRPVASTGRARPSRGLVVTLLALLAVAVGAAFWFTTTQRGPSLDANRIVVYPLLIPPDWAGSRSTGEDVATLIGSALDGAGALRVIDGWQQLTGAQRENIRLLTDADAAVIARRQRARYVINGRISARGDSADVTLSLRDVEGDTVISQHRAAASREEAWRAGLMATTQLLPRLIQTGIPDVASAWSTRAPGAVAAFLQGESAFRRGQLGEAQSRFMQAVGADSSFGLAALRGAQAASWNHDQSAAGQLITVALRHELPPHQRAFAQGYRHFLSGNADSAVILLRQALTADSSRAFIWMQIGEVYAHLHPSTGATDSLLAEALERTTVLDSAAIALYHLIEVRLRQGDTLRAAPLVRAFLAMRPDSGLASSVQLMDACVRRGPQDPVWKGGAEDRPDALLGAAAALLAGGQHLECAASGFRALLARDTLTTTESDTRRWHALIGLQGILLATGDSAAAAARIDDFFARWQVGQSLYLWNSSNAGTFQSRAAGIVAADTARAGPTVRSCEFPVRCWLLASALAEAGRSEMASSLASEIATMPNDETSAPSALLAMSIRGRIALSRGDTTRAVREFTTLLAAPRGSLTYWWDSAAPFWWERLALARVMLARGQAREALEILQVFDSRSMVAVPLLPASLALRVEAARRLGAAEVARTFQRRYDAMVQLKGKV